MIAVFFELDLQLKGYKNISENLDWYLHFSDPLLLFLQLIEAERVEHGIWNVNKSVRLSSKSELCEADISRGFTGPFTHG